MRLHLAFALLLTSAAVPAWVSAAQSQVRLVEELRIGSPDPGPYRFARVAGAGTLADGSIAVALFDGRESQVELFDRDGRHRWTRTLPGRPTLSGLAIANDTIAIVTGDGQQTQLQLLRAGNGTMIASIALGGPRGENTTLVPSSAGGIYTLTETADSPNGAYLEPREFREYSVKQFVAKANARIAVTSWIDSTPRAIVFRPRSPAKLGISLPWQPRVSVAASPRGVFIARTAQYAFDVYTTSGALERRFVVQGEALPIPTSAYDAWFTEWRNGLGRIVPDSEVPRVRAIALPPNRPIVGAFRVSATGGLAVTRLDRQRSPVKIADSTHVDFVDAAGSVFGQGVLPPGSEVLGFDDTHIIVAVRDATRLVPLGAEVALGGTPLVQLVRYRVERIR